MQKISLFKRCGSWVASISIAFTAWLAASSTTHAQLIAQDSFDSYAAGTRMWGTVSGSGDGGTGWGSTWSATSAALSTNTSGGLTYGVLGGGGGVVFGSPFASIGTAAQSQRMLSGTLTSILGGSGTVWISFLYQNWGADQAGLAGFRETGIRLISGATINGNGSANVNGTDRLDAGTPNTYAAGATDTLSLFAGGTYVSSGIATPRGANPANTVYVVLRLDVDATVANDTAYAWFNPSLASEPTTGSAITFTTADLSAINALRFQAGGLNASGTNAVWELDALSVGRTWADVSSVPEPAVVTILGFGGLMLIQVFRKKQ